jgi:hypothetical protein
MKKNFLLLIMVYATSIYTNDYKKIKKTTFQKAINCLKTQNYTKLKKELFKFDLNTDQLKFICSGTFAFFTYILSSNTISTDSNIYKYAMTGMAMAGLTYSLCKVADKKFRSCYEFRYHDNEISRRMEEGVCNFRENN